MIGRQRLEGLTDLPATLHQVGAVDDDVRNIFAMNRLEVRDALCAFPKALLPADGVDRSMVNQRQEEGAERAPSGIVGLRRAPDGQERVVNRVLGQASLPGDAEREAEGGGGVAPVELLEGASVAAQQAALQLEIGPVALLHAPLCTIPAMGVSVLMYSRPRCGLCDEARTVIVAERSRASFDFEEVDIEGDDALELEYGIRVPVILVDGEERFEVSVDPGAFADAVRR